MGVLAVIYEDGGTDPGITKIEAGARTVLHWNLEKGSILPDAVFPAPEVTATVPFGSDDGDSVQWTARPKARVALTRGGHIALNAGVEIPLSDQSWETRYHLNPLWDFADGSFFEGW